jgi:hypothetical protein
VAAPPRLHRSFHRHRHQHHRRNHPRWPKSTGQTRSPP